MEHRREMVLAGETEGARRATGVSPRARAPGGPRTPRLRRSPAAAVHGGVQAAHPREADAPRERARSVRSFGARGCTRRT